MDIFGKLFITLNEAGVEYLVCGGIAVNLYGIERATADVDLAIRLDKENLKKFAAAANSLALKPKAPVSIQDFTDAGKRKEWSKNKNMIVFSLYDAKNPYFLLDVFVEIPFDFQGAYEKRKTIALGNVTIPLAPIETLIEMKERTGRPQDRADVFHLRKILEEWNDD